MRLSFTENGQVLTDEVITNRVQENVYKGAKWTAGAVKTTTGITKAVGLGVWNGFKDVFNEYASKKTYTVEELEAMLKELKK